MNRVLTMEGLRQIISDIKGKEFSDNLRDDDIFSLAGIDSLDYVEIMVNIEQRYKCDILNLEIDWSEINTISKLNNLLYNITNK